MNRKCEHGMMPWECHECDKNELNPDWDLLAATQQSLNEHMELLKLYKIALHDAVRLPKGVIPKSAKFLNVSFDEY